MEWIVIANRIGATVYQPTETKKLRKVMSFTNPLGRLRNSMLKSDTAGSGRGRFRASSPYSLTGEKDPHRDAATQFARLLARHLVAELQNHREISLRIAAEAKFMGILKKQFTSLEMKRIHWVAKDLEKVPRLKWAHLLGIERRPNS